MSHEPKRSWNRRADRKDWSRALAIAGVATGLTLFAFPVSAQSVVADGLFELGDGVDPPSPGVGDIVGEATQAGPDWDDLFLADRSFQDVVDEFGNPGGNGVPDFLDTFGKFRLRRDGAFLADDISAGTMTDSTTLLVPGQLGQLAPGTLDPAQDIGNAYAYLAFSGARDLNLYVGAERLTSAGASMLFELNQRLFSIDGAGLVVGVRKIGDLQIRATFSAGILSSVNVQSWELLDEAQQIFGWLPLETLPLSPEQPAEQCNAAGTLCAMCNGASIDGGDWPNYDSSGNGSSTLVADTFLEIGVNLTALLGYHTWANYYDTRYASLQVSTFEDYSLASFARASRLAPYFNPPASP